MGTDADMRVRILIISSDIHVIFEGQSGFRGGGGVGLGGSFPLSPSKEREKEEKRERRERKRKRKIERGGWGKGSVFFLHCSTCDHVVIPYS